MIHVEKGDLRRTRRQLKLLTLSARRSIRGNTVMSTILHLNTEAARFDPASVFARPLDIVAERGLTLGQKLATLQRWADTLQAHLAATSEGMQTPPGTSAEDIAILDEIGMAQAFLQEHHDPT